MRRDLEERLRGADRVAAPDLWDEIEARALAPERRPERRLTTVLVSVALSAAALAVLIWAFEGGGGKLPAGQLRENGAIAYVDSAPGDTPGVDNTDLFAVDPDTGRTVNLTNTPGAAESDPVWSPDGTMVAFFRQTVEGADLTPRMSLFVMRSDGSDQREVYRCRNGQSCELQDPTWSPDATRLAWVTSDPQGNRQLVQVFDLASGETTDICDDTRCRQGLAELTWSPDGTRIAFSNLGVARVPGWMRAPSGIWVAEADGSDVVQLTRGLDEPGCREENGDCYFDTGPTWSPDGREIAFSHYLYAGARDDTQRSILAIVSAGGSDLRSFTVCEGSDRCTQGLRPQWSPDGSRIAFEGDYEEQAIKLLDPSTGEISSISTRDVSDCVNPYEPQWSPDGRELMFVAGPGRVTNVCTIGADGSGERLVVEDVSDYDLPAWLPAGAIAFPQETSPAPTSSPAGEGLEPPAGTILFATTQGDRNEDDALEIFAIDPDGSNPVQLTHNSSPDSGPVWSPDGTRIAFSRCCEPNGEVWVMNADGSDPRRLTDFRYAAGEPAWSPDGTRIAFRSSGDRDNPEGIYVMNADGTDQHLVAEGNAFSPTWFPDGTRIPFALNTPDGNRLAVVDLRTGALSTFLDLPGSLDHAALSPDGQTLAFEWYSGAGHGIYLIDADGSDLRRLTDRVELSGRPAWSPDGQWLAVVGEDEQGRQALFVVRRDGEGLREVVGYGGWMPQVQDPSWGPPHATG